MAPITSFFALSLLALSASASLISPRRSHNAAAVAEVKRDAVTTAPELVKGVETDSGIETIDDFEAFLEKDIVVEEEEKHLTKRYTSGTVRVGTMPSGFKGMQYGIGSWFRANSAQDSTNGKSWCGIDYTDEMMGFAAKFGTISPQHFTWSSSPSGWRSAGLKYCGLEAEVYYHGKRQTMYLVDAFDDQWVRTPGSIDILQGAWAKLMGYQTDNKDVVMEGLKWKFTGRRMKKYGFQG